MTALERKVLNAIRKADLRNLDEAKTALDQILPFLSSDVAETARRMLAKIEIEKEGRTR